MQIAKVGFANVRRILIRSTNWVGDAILTTPAVRAVRKNFPRAKIDILAKPWVAPVFFNSPDVDNIVLYEEGQRHKGNFGKIRLAKALRRGHYDLAVLLQNAFEAAWLTFLAGIPMRLGYNTDGRRFLLTHPVRRYVYLKQVHEVDYYLAIIKGAQLRVDGRDLTLVLSDKERKQVQWSLERNGITAEDMVVGVSPGATYGTAKRWYPERFATLCDKLCAALNARIVIFGASGEKEVGAQVAQLMQYPSVNMCGRTTLREAMALIDRCQLFITNDSGLMHVAAALSVPLVAIFGSTNPITTGPRGSHSRIVRNPVPCSPCLKPNCPTDHRCMDEITVDMVWGHVEALLNDGGAV